MQAILNVVLPVFGLILAGVLAGRFRILGQDSSEALNRFVYFFSLPAVLFLGMARAPVEKSANLGFITTYVGGTVVAFVIVVAVARVFFPGKAVQYVLGGLSGTFANTGYMGIPLFMTAFGPEGLLPVFIATVVNSAVMIGGAVAYVELDEHREAGLKQAIAKVARALATNPLVVSPIAGIAWSAAKLPLPLPVATFGDLLGAAAGPAALFAIGLFLASRSVAALMGGRRAIEVGWLVVVKLVIQPVLTWGIGWGLGLEPFWLAAAVILGALPTGALTFVLATNYGIYIERTSAVILASTVVSVLTLSVVMVLFAGVHP